MPEPAESESSYYSNFAVTRKESMNGRAPGRERVVFGAEAGRGGGTSLASSVAVATLEAKLVCSADSRASNWRAASAAGGLL